MLALSSSTYVSSSFGDDIRTAARIIGKLLQKVKPQGAVALHISLRRNLPAIREILYRLRDHIPVLGYGANLFAGRKWDDPAVQMNKYDLADILNTYGEFGMQEVFIISEMHGTCSTAWLCARRPDR
jgi:hypothetical protein